MNLQIKKKNWIIICCSSDSSESLSVLSLPHTDLNLSKNNNPSEVMPRNCLVGGRLAFSLLNEPNICRKKNFLNLILYENEGFVCNLDKKWHLIFFTKQELLSPNAYLYALPSVLVEGIWQNCVESLISWQIVIVQA